jgi:hypothetical protein
MDARLARGHQVDSPADDSRIERSPRSAAFRPATARAECYDSGVRHAEPQTLNDAPTPASLLVDGRGRPYFLWDVDMTLEEFEAALKSPDQEVRAYLVGKLMRQAKAADVPRFVTAEEARALWPILQRYLGHTREMWRRRLAIDEGTVDGNR